jgi:hypothetical protein
MVMAQEEIRQSDNSCVLAALNPLTDPSERSPYLSIMPLFPTSSAWIGHLLAKASVKRLLVMQIYFYIHFHSNNFILLNSDLLCVAKDSDLCFSFQNDSITVLLFFQWPAQLLRRLSTRVTRNKPSYGQEQHVFGDVSSDLRKDSVVSPSSSILDVPGKAREVELLHTKGLLSLAHSKRSRSYQAQYCLCHGKIYGGVSYASGRRDNEKIGSPGVKNSYFCSPGDEILGGGPREKYKENQR